MGWDSLLDLVPKLIGKAWNYHRRPILGIYFDAAETYHTRTIVENNSTGFFCHLMVRNKGEQTAKNCRARLIGVFHQEPNGEFVRHPGFVNPAILKWAHEPDFNPKDIEDLPRRLDLCYTDQSVLHSLIFFTPIRPNGNQTIFPPGTYRVRIRVDADNASRAEGVFIVRYNDVWNQVRIDPDG